MGAIISYYYPYKSNKLCDDVILDQPFKISIHIYTSEMPDIWFLYEYLKEQYKPTFSLLTNFDIELHLNTTANLKSNISGEIISFMSSDITKKLISKGIVFSDVSVGISLLN